MGKIQGDVSIIGIADLLQHLAGSCKEGLLTIAQGEQKKQLYLSPSGMRLLSTTTRRTSSLGEILIRTKKITRRQLDEFLDEQKRTGRKLGEIVGRLGLVSKRDIDRALREQVEEEIYDLFTWLAAWFEFQEGVPAPKSDSPLADAVLDANPTTIMLEAARRADELQMIMRVVRNEQMVPMKTTKLFDPAEVGDLPDIAQAVYSQISGRYSIEEVIRRSLYPRFEALRIVYLLATKGYIRIFDREGATAVSLKAETTKIRVGQSQATPIKPVAGPVPGAATDRKTILLLGEMLKYRGILASILREDGYDVLEEVASQAFHLLSDGRKVDGIILDIGISTADGSQFCSWLSENATAPIIVLSTDASRESAQKTIDCGAKAYIVKPFTREVILERLKELFRPGSSHGSSTSVRLSGGQSATPTPMPSPRAATPPKG